MLDHINPAAIDFALVAGIVLLGVYAAVHLYERTRKPAGFVPKRRNRT